jgi:hypothetical protein
MLIRSYLFDAATKSIKIFTFKCDNKIAIRHLYFRTFFTTDNISCSFMMVQRLVTAHKIANIVTKSRLILRYQKPIFRKKEI